MSERVFRAFSLRTPMVWKAIVEVVRAHAKAYIDRGTPLVVVITSPEHDALDSQRAYWHSVVLPQIAEHIADGDGCLRDVTYWHEYLVLEFLGMTETASESGKIRRQRRSTARGKITIGEYSDLITRAQAWAAQRGVEWD
ncbi:hypothetical protein [Burkholderia gladioli]|uniref:hypothetical protein n=1 Tax=Burkholderia gladioli TaxID=28095 RepID=UPI001641F8C1|nr:hypothetical protein [Burkholderia gladioli]MBJ9663175.1 hypothetical protein [Burkholderia gladioli]